MSVGSVVVEAYGPDGRERTPEEAVAVARERSFSDDEPLRVERSLDRYLVSRAVDAQGATGNMGMSVVAHQGQCAVAELAALLKGEHRRPAAAVPEPAPLAVARRQVGQGHAEHRDLPDLPL